VGTGTSAKAQVTDAILGALDHMAKPDRLNWVDRWLEDYRKTGADTGMIFGQVSG
jgi:hypothetical protein